jgi:hypothetical protein
MSLVKTFEKGTEDAYIIALYKLYRAKDKKLKDIALLEEKKRSGEKLNEDQVGKIGQKAEHEDMIKQYTSYFDMYKKAMKENAKSKKEAPKEEAAAPKAEEGLNDQVKDALKIVG